MAQQSSDAEAYAVTMRAPSPSRRRFIAATGAIGFAALAGCSDENSPEEAEEPGDEGGGGGTEEGADDEPADDGEEGTYELTVIVETEQGEPAVGAFVTVEADEGDLANDTAEQPADRDGLATFEVSNGDYTVQVDASEAEVGDGEAEEPVTIAGENLEITVTVESGEGAAGSPGEDEAGGDEDGAY